MAVNQLDVGGENTKCHQATVTAALINFNRYLFLKITASMSNNSHLIPCYISIVTFKHWIQTPMLAIAVANIGQCYYQTGLEKGRGRTRSEGAAF